MLFEFLYFGFLDPPIARVASAREVASAPPWRRVDGHKWLAVRVDDLLASRDRLAGKPQSDPAPRDSVWGLADLPAVFF